MKDIQEPRLSDDEIRSNLRKLVKISREAGIIGGPNCASAQYRAERALRPDKFLDKVREQRARRLNGESEAG